MKKFTIAVTGTGYVGLSLAVLLAQHNNVYGQTKLEGELAVANTLKKYFVVRIAWVFGLNGKNFIKTMINETIERFGDNNNGTDKCRKERRRH